MALDPVVKARLFENVYICRKCKTKVRANPMKIIAKEVICPNCGGRAFRPKKLARKNK